MATHEKAETNVRLFLGDPVLVDPAARDYLFGSPPKADAELITLRQPQDSLLRVREALQQIGLFAPERVVWIRNLRNEPESEVDALLELLEQGVPSPCRLVATAASLDQRSRLFKWFKKHDAVEDCRLERDGNGRYVQSAVAAFVKARMRANGVRSPDARAVAAIVERAGSEIGVLAQEIDKLCLAAGPAPDADAVRKHVRDMDEVWVFALTDALSNRDLGRAESLLDSLLRQGEHPLRLLANLATHVSQLREARRELEQLPRGAFGPAATSLDKRTQSLLSEPFRARYPSKWRAFHLLRGASRFRASELSDLHGRLLQIDVKMKSGRPNGHDLLMGFLVHACAARTRNRPVS